VTLTRLEILSPGVRRSLSVVQASRRGCGAEEALLIGAKVGACDCDDSVGVSRGVRARTAVRGLRRGLQALRGRMTHTTLHRGLAPRVKQDASEPRWRVALLAGCARLRSCCALPRFRVPRVGPGLSWQCLPSPACFMQSMSKSPICSFVGPPSCTKKGKIEGRYVPIVTPMSRDDALVCKSRARYCNVFRNCPYVLVLVELSR